VAYHTLFWLELYLYGSEEGFTPPAPFALIEMERGAVPNRPIRRNNSGPIWSMAMQSAERRSKR